MFYKIFCGLHFYLNLSIATANGLWLYFKNFVSHKNIVWLVFVVGGSSFHFFLQPSKICSPQKHAYV